MLKPPDTPATCRRSKRSQLLRVHTSSCLEPSLRLPRTEREEPSDAKGQWTHFAPFLAAVVEIGLFAAASAFR